MSAENLSRIWVRSAYTLVSKLESYIRPKCNKTEMWSHRNWIEEKDQLVDHLRLLFWGFCSTDYLVGIFSLFVAFWLPLQLQLYEVLYYKSNLFGIMPAKNCQLKAMLSCTNNCMPCVCVCVCFWLGDDLLLLNPLVHLSSELFVSYVFHPLWNVCAI